MADFEMNIYVAILGDDIGSLRRELNRERFFKISDTSMKTYITTSIRNGKLECLKLLLEKISEDNLILYRGLHNYSLLELSLIYNQPDIFDFLINFGLPYDMEEITKIVKVRENGKYTVIPLIEVTRIIKDYEEKRLNKKPAVREVL
jgi:hypothetical protein